MQRHLFSILNFLGKLSRTMETDKERCYRTTSFSCQITQHVTEVYCNKSSNASRVAGINLKMPRAATANSDTGQRRIPQSDSDAGTLQKVCRLLMFIPLPQ